MRTAGSLEFVAYRHQIAVRLLLSGMDTTEVAEALEVSERSVRRWWQRFDVLGEVALLPQEVPGRPPKLSVRQEAAVLGWLEQDARRFGFATQQWTAARVGAIIACRFGVCFHLRYLQQWLAARGVTPQVPEPRGRERDAALIRQWLKEDWPELKKSRGRWERPWSSPTKPPC